MASTLHGSRMSLATRDLPCSAKLRPASVRALPSRRRAVSARSEARSSEGSFMAGFVVGGVVFGALGFVLAPQLSRALLGDDQRLKLPRFLEEEQTKDPEQARQDLVEKIAQLNASIDEVAAQLKSKEVSNAIPEEGGLKIVR